MTGDTGWSELRPWPLQRRSDFPQIWTGTELIVWGGLREDTPRSFGNGARYDLSEEEWVVMSASPLTPRSRHLGVWTGSEVTYWGGITGDGDEPETVGALADGAAYQPRTDSWRMLADSPLLGGSRYAGVWTGDKVVVVGPEEGEVASYDPSNDHWTSLPPRPPQGHSTNWISAFWTGREIVVVTSSADRATTNVYDPETDRWRSMPPTPFQTMQMSVTSGSPAHALHGSTVWLSGFAPQDYGIVGVDIATGEWVTSPPLPGTDCTDIPSVTGTDNGPLVESCGIAAILVTDERWDQIPALPRTLPKLPGPDPVWTGDHLLLLEAGIEPGAVNFPDGAEPHFWLSDLPGELSTPPSVHTAKTTDVESCAASFYAAVDSNSDVREPRDDEELMIAFQDSYEWEGRYPVCWAVYQSDTTRCQFFTLDITGVYSEPRWAESGSEGSPCLINPGPGSYQEYPAP